MPPQLVYNINMSFQEVSTGCESPPSLPPSHAWKINSLFNVAEYD